MEFIKKAENTAEQNSEKSREIVKQVLADIEARGEDAVRELAKKFDGWEGDFILSDEKLKRITSTLTQREKDDIKFAYDQVYSFAVAQRNSLQDFEVESLPGVRLGQKIKPMEVAGCYIPGGRYAHICSAVMSVATAKAAGVPFVIACSPPRGESIDPAVAYALELSGADAILEMGGIQAIATMAYGLFTGKPANLLCGPGNSFVAEAKAMLASSGLCGIDIFAGPTETAIIADKDADPATIAIDLVSQAEHGLDSPAWLFTDSREVAEKVNELMPIIINQHPTPDVPGTSWRDYGEIILCDSKEELCKVSDDYAPEHLQVIASDLEWWLENLQCYGSLFMGEGSTVSHGDKCSGTNHILPTKKAAKYSGGLNVHKFLKITTYQELDEEASKSVGAVASRLCRMEGMEGHARSCDWRLEKYFPNEKWDFTVYKHKL
ncbi:MAG: histidinol dehydrogenase [Halodesulfovibrio sp.]|uniref:histidinol dehydrogenase n=1 Tax=Halodesulfovibrio sp. TaxID=1912772 RepID=UPI00359CDD63